MSKETFNIRLRLFLKLSAVILCLGVLNGGESMAAVFKIGTISPEGSVWMETMRKGAEEVAEATEGRVKFKFYPGGVMGSDQAVLRKIRIGQLHGGAIVAGSISHIYPDIMIYGLPFLFDSYDEVDCVREEMDSLLMEGLEKEGLVTFGIAEGGFVYVMSDSPVRTIEDLRAQKVWIPDNDFISLEAVRSFGITPITLPIGEVRTGLQTGLINTVGTSPIGALALQWHTQIDYLMDVPLMYVYATMILDKKKFSRLSSSDQQAVRNIMERVFEDLDDMNRHDNIGAMDALKNQGIEFIQLSGDTVGQWKDAVSQVPERLIEKDRLSSGIFRVLKNQLERCRAEKQ